MSSRICCFLLPLACVAAAAAASAPVAISLASTKSVNTLDSTYVSYNADPSCNRGFHQTRFDNANLIAAATGLHPSRLRFGGSGADNLIYGLTPGAPECANVPPAPPPLQPGCDYITPGCLNASHWDGLYQLAAASGTEFLFGVSYALNDACAGGASWRWNASNVQVLIDHVIANNQTLWGMEVANEPNNNGGAPCNLQPSAQAAAFALLQQTLAAAKLDAVKLVGPDTGGRYPETWLRDFLPLVKPRLLTAITHHVYNGVDRKTFASPAQVRCATYLALAYPPSPTPPPPLPLASSPPSPHSRFHHPHHRPLRSLTTPSRRLRGTRRSCAA